MAKKKQSGKKAGTKATKKVSKKKSSGQVPTVVVRGPASIHEFDLGLLSNLSIAAVMRAHRIRQADIEFCTEIQTAFSRIQPPTNLVKVFPDQKFFRVCSPGRNPLDTAGTFGAGGRCNFGMCQRCPEFKGLRASYGLYASMDAQTASIEAASGMPSSHDITYEITKKDGSVLRLIDFDGMVAHLESAVMGITRMVAETPYYADWSLQHNPKPSQMIGEWLRAGLSQNDGLFFSSTKNPLGKNVLIFATSASGLHADYTAIRI